MSEPIVVVENLSKLYELGIIGGRTLRESLQRRWYRLRGKEHLLRKIGAKHQMMGPDHPQAGPRPHTMWALRDVSFAVNEGEVLGIIGRNGAGKSTLLKILTRITEPTSGRAFIYGRVASLLEVGTGFHPELTGRENIYLSGAILGMKKAEINRKFDEIVAFSEVEQFIDTPVKRYSSGMYVRLAFAVAAHLDPEILLVDEVLAVGDAAFQKKCLGKMEDVARTGRTVLFVSHNLAAIRRLCTHAILFELGRIKLQGSASNAVAAYLCAAPSHSPAADLSGLAHTGSGEARITEARLTNASGEPSTQFWMDEEMAVRFGIEAAAPGLKLTHAVEIVDSEGLPIYHFWDIDEQQKTASHGSRREVVAHLPALDLYPGDYSITLWIGRKETRIDRVENCLRFSIKKPDRIEREFLRSRGLIHRQAKWAYNAELASPGQQH